MDRSTIAIHAGRGPRVAGAPLNAPLVLASSFHGGDYAREEGSPTWEAFEDAIGALEGGAAVAFSSGTAGAAAIIETLPAKARVVAPVAGYAWTRSLLATRAAVGRISLVTVDTTDTGATLRAAEGADLLWLESPSNPLLEVAELDVLCAAGVPVAVDSTFASPLLQRPLELGATFSMHSATKFIGGHSDLLMGVISTRDPAALRHARAQVGATPGALEAFLALRGLRTLPLRLEASSRTAATLAERLSAHRAVRAVHYPGLEWRERASRFMDAFGAMLSFEVADPAAVCARVRVFTHAKSLGGVESLIDVRGPSLLRLSVGCEHVEDLWRDLDEALQISG
ncbi:trans-sulfuration enzyme family protein [Solirubrobacter soli]|uniref:trans-sulfuration enzyme family protein n=1 Tax=Solirubrobacter soli TaxID=363832 RepID=UPI0004090269|nr:PLP-dependent aspartate aminotransferase family protein [Solirubrobacter soli]